MPVAERKVCTKCLTSAKKEQQCLSSPNMSSNGWDLYPCCARVDQPRLVIDEKEHCALRCEVCGTVTQFHVDLSRAIEQYGEIRNGKSKNNI